MKQTFAIPGRLDGINEYTDACRINRYAGAKLKRHNQDIVCWVIKSAQLKPMGKVNISYKWIEPNMKRDKGNIRGADKFIEDALVEMGIIKNDGWKHIGDISDEFYINKSNPRIEVTLEEVVGA